MQKTPKYKVGDFYVSISNNVCRIKETFPGNPNIYLSEFFEEGKYRTIPVGEINITYALRNLPPTDQEKAFFLLKLEHEGLL